MKGRFYIGKREREDESLEVWIADKVLDAMPPGQVCECGVHAEHMADDYEGDCADGATTFSYRIEDEHVCYTYLCQSCADAQGLAEDYLADNDYPQTTGGYAVAPRHCA